MVELGSRLVYCEGESSQQHIIGLNWTHVTKWTPVYKATPLQNKVYVSCDNILEAGTDTLICKDTVTVIFPSLLPSFRLVLGMACPSPVCMPSISRETCNSTLWRAMAPQLSYTWRWEQHNLHIDYVRNNREGEVGIDFTFRQAQMKHFMKEPACDNVSSRLYVAIRIQTDKFTCVMFHRRCLQNQWRDFLFSTSLPYGITRPAQRLMTGACPARIQRNWASMRGFPEGGLKQRRLLNNRKK